MRAHGSSRFAAARHEKVDWKGNELGRHFVELILVSLRQARLKANALALDVPQLLERLPEGLPPVEAARLRSTKVEEPKDRYLPRGSLRPDGERRGEEHRTRASEERATVYRVGLPLAGAASLG